MSAVYEQALAVIKVRREMLAAGTPGPWRQKGMGTCGCCVYLEPLGDRAPIDDRDAALITAAVNAYAADTDALEAVLLRHRGVVGCFTQLPVCRACSDFEERTERTWPCADAQAALTALGVAP